MLRDSPFPTVRTQPKALGVAARTERLWRRWCEANRREFDHVPVQFRKAYAKSESGVSDDDAVRAALRMRQTDPLDWRRLARALAGREGTSARIIRFRNIAPKTARSDVLALCDDVELSQDQDDYLVELCARTADELTEAAADLEVVTPETLAHRLHTGKRTATAVTKTDNRRQRKHSVVRTRIAYDNGKNESRQLESVSDTLQFDPAADALYLGGDLDAAIRLHRQAPDGYWADVAIESQQGGGLAEAYASLQDKYGFHPDERQSK